MNMSSKRGAVALIAIMLAGCTVGPNFQRPQTEMPLGWVPPTSQPTTQQSIATVQPADIGRWWTVFNDPTLNSLIDRAIAANLDLGVAEARVREARASLIISRANLWPSLDSSASYTRSGTIQSKPGDLYRTGLDASWEIDVFGGTRRNVESAAASLQASIENRSDALVTLTSEVALNYIALRSLQREIEIAFSNLETQKNSANVTRRKYNNGNGFVGKLDVVNAESAVASTEATIPSLESQVRQSIYALSVLLGLQPAALMPELSQPAAIPIAPPRVPVGLPSELLRRRPDIRAAEAQLHAATANIGVATADLYPRFSLDGSFDVLGNTPGRLLSFRNNGWAIGPAVSWNIFDAGQIRANIEFQNAAQQAALLTYQQTILNALQDVESALVAYETEQHHREFLKVTVDNDQQAVELSTQLYQNGQTDFLNVLTAQRSLFGSQTALVASDQTIATDLVALYKALGGGWEFEQEPTTQPATQPSN